MQTTSSPSFAQSIERDMKETCKKNWPREILGISHNHFFLWISFASVDFFCINRPSERGTTCNLFFRISYLLCYREIVSDKTHNMRTAVGHPNPRELMSKTLLIKAYPKPSSILICLTDSRISRIQSEFSALASRIIRVMM